MEPREPQKTETNMPVQALDDWLGNTIQQRKENNIHVTLFLMHSLPNGTTREKYNKYYKQDKDETCL